MSRMYQGIGLNTIPDKATRSALQAIDTYLRDVSADLSMSTGATGTISTALAEPYLVVGALSATLTDERQLVVQTPLSASDGGAGASYTLSVSFATPGLTLGTANAAGANDQPIRSDATILAFDVTVPAASAAAAAVGTATVAARRDHVHLFPTTLQSTGTVNTLALTAVSGTESTLTSSAVTVILAGATTLRPSSNNAITLGATTRRWLQVFVGTSGISNTGGYTQASGTATNQFLGATTMGTVEITQCNAATLAGFGGGPLVIDSDVLSIKGTGSGDPGGWNLGGPAGEWGDIYLVDDVDDAYHTIITVNSTATQTANRTLTLDVDNADRTLRCAWLGQDVATTASPTFASVKLDDSASAFNIVMQATGTGMSADRALTLDIGNAARTLTLSGNPTLADWFDQAVKSSSSPQFGNIGIGGAADATAKLTVEDSVAAPSTNLVAFTTNRYGGDTNYCGDPNIWLRIRIGGANYKIPCYS